MPFQGQTNNNLSIEFMNIFLVLWAVPKEFVCIKGSCIISIIEFLFKEYGDLIAVLLLFKRGERTYLGVKHKWKNIFVNEPGDLWFNLVHEKCL